jgi:hypothetical protein
VKIKELNVEGVKPSATEIRVTRDSDSNKLTTSQYDVKTTGLDGEDWKTHTYTIPEKNFADEGNYDVVISTKDTNNSQDNKNNEYSDEFGQAEVKFVVDKTNPTTVLSGVEGEKQYRTNEKEIVIDAKDNILLNGVVVTVDGKVVKEYTKDEVDEIAAENGGTIPYQLANSDNWQDVAVYSIDKAGNTDKETVLSEKTYRVLVTSNLLVQFYRNTPVFVTTIVVLVAVLAALFYIFFIKKQREEEEAKKKARANARAKRK